MSTTCQGLWQTSGMKRGKRAVLKMPMESWENQWGLNDMKRPTAGIGTGHAWEWRSVWLSWGNILLLLCAQLFPLERPCTRSILCLECSSLGFCRTGYPSHQLSAQLSLWEPSFWATLPSCAALLQPTLSQPWVLFSLKLLSPVSFLAHFQSPSWNASSMQARTLTHHDVKSLAQGSFSHSCLENEWRGRGMRWGKQEGFS